MSTPLPSQPQSFRLMVGETYTLTANAASWAWPGVAPKDPNRLSDGWPPINTPAVGQQWPDPTWASVDTAVATVAPVASSHRAVVTAVAPGATLITATVSGTKQQFVLDVVAAAPEWVAVVGAR